jgi:stress-induced-phosphoprotein 1
MKKRRKEEEKQRAERDRLAAMSPNQIQAEILKNEANDSFKGKRYEEAVEKYNQAHELDPTNMVYYSNIGAVYFAQERIDECIDICNRALEIGYANRGDLTLKARALSRLGNCHFKKGDFETAISYYNKSLLEQSDRNVSQQLRKTEKELAEKKKSEYINPALAEAAREEGNEFFKAGKYPEAVKSYSESIKRNPLNPIPYSNRATAFTKLGEFREAIKDCDKAIELDPTFIKAYIKKGHAYFVMEDFSQCLTIYDTALQFDPDNEEIKESINKTIFKINSSTRDEETVKKNIENNPEVQEILRDPMMRQVLQDLQNDRNAAMRHFSNPEIKRKLDKLMAAGVIQ